MYLVVSKSSVFDVKGFYPLQHHNWLATSNRATLGFHFSLAVLGSIGDKFGFTSLRSYCPKSEFYHVFKQDKRPRLDFERIFICLCLRSFDANTDKALSVQNFSPDRPKITKLLMVDFL